MPPELPSEDPTELGQLLVDDSDGEGEDDNTLAKTSSALNVVRTKLIRHISHDNDPDRRSRASAGHSQEEVARRAELRRFRHQRIQEELKNEESKAESSDTSHRSTRYLSPLIDPGQPRVGPRDTIEFTVTDGHSLSLAQIPSARALETTTTEREEICSTAQEGDGVTKPLSTHLVPNTEGEDHTHPLRPPSTHSNASQKLAGCSYNVPRLDRVLGTDNEFDIRHGAHAWEEQSALGIWLAAQGLRWRSSSGRPGDSETNDRNVRDQVPSPNGNFGGIDSAADGLLPTQCQDIGKVKLQNHGDSLESASFPSSLPNDHLQGDADTTLLDRNVPLESRLLGISTTRPVDTSSSNYPSVLPSFQPSPNRSQSNFHHLSAEDLESLELSPFSWQGNFSVIKSIHASEGKSSYATAEDDIFYSDNNASSTQINCLPAQASADALSLACSETADFHKQEAKTQTIGARVGGALSRKRPSLNFGSRFKEEFQTTSIGSGRRSFMAKINLSVPRRPKLSSGSFRTMQSRHYSTERSPLALEYEHLDGMRMKSPAGRPSSFQHLEGCFPSSGPSPAVLANVYDCQKPLISRQPVAFETSRLTPHSDELLPDDTPSRRILQQWTTNIQGAFSPNSTSKLQKRLTKTPPLRPHNVPNSCEEKVTDIGLHRQQPDEDGNSLPEPGSRFGSGKLGKAVRSGFKKLMPSYDNGKQTQLSRFPGNSQHNENENYFQSKIARMEALPAGSDRLKIAMKEIVEYDTVSPSQHLSADFTLCRQPPAMAFKNSDEVMCTENVVRTDVGLKPLNSVERVRISHHMASKSMVDAIHQPQSRLKLTDEEEAESKETDSTSTVSNVRVLRRWKSALDAPTKTKPSTIWTGTSIAHSLSLGNLGAS
ncbi:glutathione-dependent formaldehyde-activating enzyme [Trichoderma arundinaceum]|uniref:Glutathione-dependent formaldehyde-activating enzyme n=1 Tax=Trichoderma arundinaceum TaxID=490622 RepID=A0A395NSQ2_TRIAR|nr:glutathione-dependent formaldehyde-activating enzyme [Trichoderma arundinaceum]